jgi:hypothetical protein|nr:MAG TPA: hypothetical protein [Caudoviricetes sp.]
MNEVILNGVIVQNDTFNLSYFFDKYGFLGETTVNLPLQITNNYVESNVALQDHIAKPPITITLSGLIGEVVFKPPTNFLKKTNNAFSNKFGFTPKLTLITALLPSVSNITQMARNTTQYIESSYTRYLNIFENIRRGGENVEVVLTNQEQAFKQLSDLRDSNAFVDVITSWFTFKNYAISDIRLRQDASTNYTSSLELTLQEWREVGTKMTTIDTKQYSERCAVQKAAVAVHGKAQGKEKPVSLLLSLVRSLYK